PGPLARRPFLDRVPRSGFAHAPTLWGGQGRWNSGRGRRSTDDERRRLAGEGARADGAPTSASAAKNFGRRGRRPMRARIGAGRRRLRDARAVTLLVLAPRAARAGIVSPDLLLGRDRVRRAAVLAPVRLEVRQAPGADRAAAERDARRGA